MRVCIYGTEEDKRSLVSAIDECRAMTFRQVEADLFDNYDDLIRNIQENRYDLTVIMADGAEGMEGVIAVKSLLPEVPVIWFSDDRAFGAQSYRLNAAFFHQKPVTTQLLGSALASCCLI